MIIPHRMLSPEALHRVIETFVTREGTDYGEHDIPLATKVLQVRQQLDAGMRSHRLRPGNRKCYAATKLPGHSSPLAHTRRLLGMVTRSSTSHEACVDAKR